MDEERVFDGSRGDQRTMMAEDPSLRHTVRLVCNSLGDPGFSVSLPVSPFSTRHRGFHFSHTTMRLRVGEAA